MAASTLSPRPEMVLRRHVPPAQLRLLKISAFDLMTRPELIGQMPAEPNQSTNRPDARRVGKFIESLRSTVRPKIGDAPTLGPGHKVGTVWAAAPGRQRSRKQVCPGRAIGGLAGYAVGRSTAAPGGSGSPVVEPYHFPTTSTRSRIATDRSNGTLCVRRTYPTTVSFTTHLLMTTQTTLASRSSMI